MANWVKKPETNTNWVKVPDPATNKGQFNPQFDPRFQAAGNAPVIANWTKVN